MAYTDQREVDAAETAEDRDAAPWLAMIEDAQRCFKEWQDKCDNIAKRYADLKRMAEGAVDREFQIFWANLEVLKPAIYSRPPVPVVTPRFKDRKPLPRKAAELLERALVTDFEVDDVDSTMVSVRDDLALVSRGVPWVRYEGTEEGERVIAEHLDRKDFLHAPARKWKEVDWVARRAWLTRKQGEARFGDAWAEVEMKQREVGGDKEYKGEKKGEVWEVWHKTEEAVVWVSPSVEEVLDIQPPLHSLEGFFPCPRPAYGTLQPETLLPIPDFVYYKDQVEEINELTARISALSESLRLKGFYAGGGTDIGDAIETAIKNTDDRAILVPVSNMAALGGNAAKDAIVWLPVDMVAQVITGLVQLRRELIDDVYQITGLSDIMRGATDPNETLGAQQLKSQFGSIRVRTKQNELVRVARDITRLKAEIMAEQFAPETLMEMSQVDDLPTTQALQQQGMALMQAAQQGDEQAASQVQELQNTVTLEAVVNLLRSERLRPFILEIETDSTIQPDEDADKQRRTEFITAIGGFLQQAAPMVQQQPQTGPFVAEMLKFVASGFRAGRQLDSAIDEFAETIQQMAQQPQPDPELVKAQAEAEDKDAERQLKREELERETTLDRQKLEQEAAFKARELDLKERELALKGEQMVADEQARREQMQFDREGREADGKRSSMEANAKSGLPADFSFQAVLDEMAAMREQQAQRDAEQTRGIQQNAEALAQLGKAMMAPKRVLRDGQGRAVGVETAGDMSDGDR